MQECQLILTIRLMDHKTMNQPLANLFPYVYTENISHYTLTRIYNILKLSSIGKCQQTQKKLILISTYVNSKHPF